MVDKAFEDFLAELTGREILERFKKENIEDYMELMRQFAIKKRSSDISFSQKFFVQMSGSLMDVANATNRKTFRELIKGSRYTNQKQKTPENPKESEDSKKRST